MRWFHTSKTLSCRWSMCVHLVGCGYIRKEKKRIAITGTGLTIYNIGFQLNLFLKFQWVNAMARPLRIEFAGALYHTTARGNARQDIYWTDDDREQFLKILQRVNDRYQWQRRAYCLMSNHYHLLIETRTPSLSKWMQMLNDAYTQTVNRTHNRAGHVFQGLRKRRNAAMNSDKLTLRALLWCSATEIQHLTRTMAFACVLCLVAEHNSNAEPVNITLPEY